MITLVGYLLLGQTAPNSAEWKKLETRANQFKNLAVKKDLGGLFKLCDDRIECIEVIRLTTARLNYDKGTLFGVKLYEDKLGFQLKREFIKIKSPTQEERKILLAFCDRIAVSSKVDAWIKVEESLGDDAELLVPFPGKGLIGKYASNSLWRVDFELRKGQWKATKLIEAAR